jgi:hypothetical protein
MHKIKVKVDGEVKEVLSCSADDMHPYNCDYPYGGSCIHCEKKVFNGHNPETCALCNYFED